VVGFPCTARAVRALRFLRERAQLLHDIGARMTRRRRERTGLRGRDPSVIYKPADASNDTSAPAAPAGLVVR